MRNTNHVLFLCIYPIWPINAELLCPFQLVHLEVLPTMWAIDRAQDCWSLHFPYAVRRRST